MLVVPYGAADTDHKSSRHGDQTSSVTSVSVDSKGIVSPMLAPNTPAPNTPAPGATAPVSPSDATAQNASSERLKIALATASDDDNLAPSARVTAYFVAMLRRRCEQGTIDGVPTEQIKREIIVSLTAAGLNLGTYATQTNVWSAAFRHIPTLERSQRLDLTTGKNQWIVKVV